MENKKKSKGFVETPEVIVNLMHKYIALNQKETLADFTAGKGKLFLEYNPDLCFGIEIDEENYNHISVKYKNIILGDFFEKIEDMPVVDALILNPPYIKTSNEIIYKSLQKLKEGGRFAIISKESSLKQFKTEYHDHKEKLEEVYMKLKAIPVGYKVIIAVRGAFLDTGSPEKKTSYFEDVERMILNAQYES